MEKAHKLAFLKTFRRWERLFARRDKGNDEAEMWLVSEYYQSLSFLTEKGFGYLTDELKQRHTFFPSIRECLEVARPTKRDYSTVFACDPKYNRAVVRADVPALPPRSLSLTYDG